MKNIIKTQGLIVTSSVELNKELKFKKNFLTNNNNMMVQMFVHKWL
jgi:hypothetical protein